MRVCVTCTTESRVFTDGGSEEAFGKQYRYHPIWCQGRNENKFHKLPFFARALPTIRKRVQHDLRSVGLKREKVLAAVVETMAETMIRIGNDEYAEENDSYGLTTLRNDQASIHGSEIRFKFRGKSDVVADISISDKRLSRILHRCQEIPGQKLFAFEAEDGSIHEIESGDVNGYLKGLTQEAITAKSFRTWGATVRAAETLFKMGPADRGSEREFKSRQIEATKAAAAYLGNTQAVCRKYYIHPKIFEADKDGCLQKIFAGHFNSKRRKRQNTSALLLGGSELAVLELISKKI